MANKFLTLCMIAGMLIGCNNTTDKSRTAENAKSRYSDVTATPTGAALAKAVNSSLPSAKQLKATVYSASELAKVLDATALPTLDGTKFMRKSAATVTAQAPNDVETMTAFYQKSLQERGWQEVAGTNRSSKGEYASLQLTKDGHVVDLQVGKCSSTKEGVSQSEVTLTYHGNFDTRSLPMPDSKEALALSQIASSYFVDLTVAAMDEWVRNGLPKLGWQSFTAPNAKAKEPAEDGMLTFFKQGYVLTVYAGIHPVRKKTFFQYSVAARAHELPAPADATKIEFSDDRWILRCEAPGDMKTLGGFYQQAMPEAGYKALPSEDAKPTYWNLRFGTDQGDIIMVQVTPVDDNSAKVSIEGIPAAFVEKMNQADRKPKAP